MTGSTVHRPGRVIVGYDETPTGHNALWHGVQHALRDDAPLFVVSVRPSPRPAPQRPLPPVTPEQLGDHERTRITDSLLLAVGEIPPGLAVRVAVMHGDPIRTLDRLADRAGDVLIIPATATRGRIGRRARPAHRGRRTATLITIDAVAAPVAA